MRRALITICIGLVIVAVGTLLLTYEFSVKAIKLNDLLTKRGILYPDVIAKQASYYTNASVGSLLVTAFLLVGASLVVKKARGMPALNLG